MKFAVASLVAALAMTSTAARSLHGDKGAGEAVAAVAAKPVKVHEVKAPKVRVCGWEEVVEGWGGRQAHTFLTTLFLPPSHPIRSTPPPSSWPPPRPSPRRPR